jgi:hypothetical protein
LCREPESEKLEALVVRRLSPCLFVRCLSILLLTLAQAAVADDEQPLIRFAGGAIEFQLPQGWDAAEVPFAREVHLVLSPSRSNATARIGTGRIWLACHAVGTLGNASADLAEVIAKRVSAVTQQHGQITRTQRVRIADCDGVMVDFTAKHPTGTTIRGGHLLLRSEVGLCEIHLVAPENEYAQVNTAGTSLLRTLLVRAPIADRGVLAAHASDAASVVGAWKAVRSRLYLDGRGNIAIEFDRLTHLTSTAQNDTASRRINGRFTATGDLLYVTWADGSRLNYRWRLVHGDLLLTDNDGNVSQLRRLVH